MTISAPQDHRAQAEAAAAAWWADKPFPESPWGRPYLCDICGSPITAREGTALVESRLECPTCTDRTFPRAAPPAPEAARQFVPYPAAPPAQPVQPTVWTPQTAPPTQPPPPPTQPLPTQPLLTQPAPVVPTPPRPAPPAPRRPRGNRRKWVLIGLAILAVAALVVGLVAWAPWVKHPPKVPANVRKGTVAATTVEVRWDAAEKGPKPDTYVISRNGSEVGKVSGTATSYKDEGLQPGTTYRYSVLASAGSRRSGWSTEVAATTVAPPPRGLARGTVTTDSISFRWSAPADAPTPDQYLILRDGTNIATVSGTTRSYRDTKLEPMHSYEYEVSAVWSGHRSYASDSLKLTTRKPSLTSARVGGSFDMRIRIVTSGGGDLTPGLSWVDTWYFTPKCSSGPCSESLEGEFSPAGFASHGFTVTLTRVGGLYTGTTRAHITHCGVKPLVVDVQNTISVRLRVTAGDMTVLNGVLGWNATRLSGDLTMNAPYVSAGAYYCPAQSVTTTLSGS